MEKQTAVEWLIQQLNEQIKKSAHNELGTIRTGDYRIGLNKAIDFCEQAKEMEAKQKQLDLTNITRLEVINHAKNDHPIGRLLTMYKETEDFTVVDAEFQDGNRTLKIFIS